MLRWAARGRKQEGPAVAAPRWHRRTTAGSTALRCKVVPRSYAGGERIASAVSCALDLPLPATQRGVRRIQLLQRANQHCAMPPSSRSINRWSSPGVAWLPSGFAKENCHLPDPSAHRSSKLAGPDPPSLGRGGSRPCKVEAAATTGKIPRSPPKTAVALPRRQAGLHGSHKSARPHCTKGAHGFVSHRQLILWDAGSFVRGE